MKRVIPFFMIACLVSGNALAKQTKAERREQRQENRIEQGIESGQLTEKEAAKLQAGQVRIDEAQEKAASDGQMTKKEKRHINKMQNNQSQKIRREKHDKQKKF